VAELDSALNKWMDSVPDHRMQCSPTFRTALTLLPVRWEPSQDNEVFYDQSVMLYASYYHLQISIHRPFIPSPHKPSPMIAFPSMAICTNAARACSHVVDVKKRRSRRPMPHLQVSTSSSFDNLLTSCTGRCVLCRHRACDEHLGRQTFGNQCRSHKGDGGRA
jgi:hypothetical protein